MRKEDNRQLPDSTRLRAARLRDYLGLVNQGFEIGEILTDS
jgi:hypothetical protein